MGFIEVVIKEKLDGPGFMEEQKTKVYLDLSKISMIIPMNKKEVYVRLVDGATICLDMTAEKLLKVMMGQ